MANLIRSRSSRIISSLAAPGLYRIARGGADIVSITVANRHTTVAGSLKIQGESYLSETNFEDFLWMGASPPYLFYGIAHRAVNTAIAPVYRQNAPSDINWFASPMQNGDTRTYPSTFMHNLSNWTFETFVMFNSVTVQQCIFDSRTAVNSNNGLSLYMSPTGFLELFSYSQGTIWRSSAAMAANTPYHIIIAASSTSVFTVCINGVINGGATLITYVLQAATGTMTIGNFHPITNLPIYRISVAYGWLGYTLTTAEMQQRYSDVSSGTYLTLLDTPSMAAASGYTASFGAGQKFPLPDTIIITPVNIPIAVSTRWESSI